MSAKKAHARDRESQSRSYALRIHRELQLLRAEGVIGMLRGRRRLPKKRWARLHEIRDERARKLEELDR